MPFYETVFIARQDLGTAQVEELTKQFSEILTKAGGKITKQDGTVVETVDDGMILGMNWYVKGVDDKLPQ